MKAQVRLISICSAWLFNLALCLPAHESPVRSTDNRFDYVIVGGGTAGLVAASRLSEDPHVTVAVIEAGDFERNNPNVTDTTVLGIAKNTRLDWQYEGVPQTYVANQSMIWSAGKGVGGSTLINGMTYMRPSSSQIDLWSSLGLDIDWNVLFNSSTKGEHFQPPSPAQTLLGACYEQTDHGFSGPLTTCISPHMPGGDIHDIFNTTFKKLGIPPRCDFNGGDLRGFGVQMVTQDGIADVREDAARAYYYPVMERKNLIIMVNTTVTRIIWAEDRSSVLADGVEILGQTGEVSRVHADQEVILSAGAIRSPAILEHSGIGNAVILARQSIDVKVDLPAVGENFQDQTTMAIIATALQNHSEFPVFVAHTSLEDLFGDGTPALYQSTLAKLPEYAAKITEQNQGASSAAVQERLLRSQLDLLWDSNTPASEIAPVAITNFIGGVFWPLQPFSRGSVHINSTNSTMPPAINANFFQADFDQQVAIATAKFVRRFFTTAPASALIDATTLAPSFELVPEDADDEVWLKWLQSNSSLAPNYHHLGTCAMLPKDMGGVVGNDFRVYGTENVRVVDLSVLPFQVAGHSMAVLYGVAEWAAEKIRRKPCKPVCSSRVGKYSTLG